MSDDEFWLRGYNSELEEMPTVNLKASLNCTLEENNDYLDSYILHSSYVSPLNSPLPPSASPPPVPTAKPVCSSPVEKPSSSSQKFEKKVSEKILKLKF